MISLIYARSLNRCIGNKGHVPWSLPDEFAHFEATTMGKPVIMGRKTYEDHRTELPGRLNIVVSTQRGYQTVEAVKLVQSLDQAFALARQSSNSIFIIGGADLYSAALPHADIVYESIVDIEIDGDTILPPFDFEGWNTELLQDHPIDERHVLAFTVYRHTRPR